MKTYRPIVCVGTQNADPHQTLGMADADREARSATRQKGLRLLDGSGPWASICKLATGLGFLVATLHAEPSSSNSFSDDNWISIGAEKRWLDGSVDACATDSSGNLYIGGSFTHVGTMPANGIAKWDGTTWSTLGDGVRYSSNPGFVGTMAFHGNALYVGGWFTEAGGVEARHIAKWNGSTWSPVGTGVDGFVSALAIFENKLYAGGGFKKAGGVRVNGIAQWDGANWSALGSGMAGGEVYALAVHGGELYAGGSFTTAGGPAAYRVARWDGIAWHGLGPGISGGRGLVVELASFDGDLFAAGDFTAAGGVPANNIAAWDGTNWWADGLGTDDFVTAMTASDDTLYVGGRFDSAGGAAASRVATWDGETWSPMGSGFEGLGVRSIAVSGSTVYAGGAFTAAGGMAANGIAMFEDSDWSPIEPGVKQEPVVYWWQHDIQGLTATEDALYAFGSFTDLEGFAVTNIAKWDGSTWSPFGEDLEGNVNSILASGSDVYVGGDIYTDGGLQFNGIAKWDGATWSSLGGGLRSKVPDPHSPVPYVSGSASDLAMLGSDLYVGGMFDRAGNVGAKSIAKWNGTSWAPVGSGFSTSIKDPYSGQFFSAVVSDLAIVGADLYAAGGFDKAGAVAVTNIARWNGSVWAPLGSGVNGGVSALAVSGTNLYVGGTFTTAGGTAANNIGRWDGSTWSALGAGLNGPVYAIAVSGSNIFVTGEFTAAGEVAAHHFAVWDGTAWLPQVAGFNGYAQAIAVWQNKLFAGGSGLWMAGGRPTTGIAHAFLDVVPPLEVGDGWANIFFRESDGAAPSRWHQIERTTKFDAWEVLGNYYTSETGGIDFTDNDAPPDKAFYRAVPVTEQ